jgi:hypothetical protein
MLDTSGFFIAAFGGEKGVFECSKLFFQKFGFAKFLKK